MNLTLERLKLTHIVFEGERATNALSRNWGDTKKGNPRKPEETLGNPGWSSYFTMWKIKETQENPRKPKETQENPRKPKLILRFYDIFKYFWPLQSYFKGNMRKPKETQTDFKFLWHFWVFLTFHKLFPRKLKE